MRATRALRQRAVAVFRHVTRAVYYSLTNPASLALRVSGLFFFFAKWEHIARLSALALSSFPSDNELPRTVVTRADTPIPPGERRRRALCESLRANRLIGSKNANWILTGRR